PLWSLLSRLRWRRLRDALLAWRQGFSAVDHWSSTFFARGRREVGAVAALLFLQWLTEAGETFLVARVLGIPIGFGLALAFEAATSLIRGAAFFLPAGLGLQDGLHVLLVQAAGVPHAETIGAAFLFTKRIKELFWIVVGSSLWSFTKWGVRGR